MAAGKKAGNRREVEKIRSGSGSGAALVTHEGRLRNVKNSVTGAFAQRMGGHGRAHRASIQQAKLQRTKVDPSRFREQNGQDAEPEASVPLELDVMETQMPSWPPSFLIASDGATRMHSTVVRMSSGADAVYKKRGWTWPLHARLSRPAMAYGLSLELSRRGISFCGFLSFFGDHQPSPTQASGEVSTAPAAWLELDALSPEA